jgi:hypothetical protein
MGLRCGLPRSGSLSDFADVAPMYSLDELPVHNRLDMTGSLHDTVSVIATPQHRNTATPQHRNTAAPLIARIDPS